MTGNSIYSWKPRTYYIIRNITSGKKYIGQTTKNMESYLGSGSYWKNHCKKHGGYCRENIEIVFKKKFNFENEAKLFLKNFEKQNPEYWLQENKIWANQVRENTENSPFFGKDNTSNQLKNCRHVSQTKTHLKKGTHNFFGGDIQRNQNLKRVEKRTHNFLKENATEDFLLKKREGNRKSVQKKIGEGTFHLSSGEIQKKSAKERLANGTHNFSNNFGTIAVYDKNGKYKRITTELYYSENHLDAESRMYVSISSKEGKKRSKK